MNKRWIPQMAVSGMLLLALNPGNPYEYYILLRWVCCAVFAYLALQAVALKQQDWVWILGVTAAVYNPIVPLHLTREIWTVINLVTIGIAVASIFVVVRKDETFDVSRGIGKTASMSVPVSIPTRTAISTEPEYQGQLQSPTETNR